MIEQLTTEQLSEIFKNITDKMITTFEKKNHDYGNSFFESLKKRGLIAALVRIEDKINRLNTLIDKNAKVDESISDTLLDLANYSIMTLMWNDQNKYNKKNNCIQLDPKWININNELPQHCTLVYVVNESCPEKIKQVSYNANLTINHGFITNIDVTHWHY